MNDYKIALSEACKIADQLDAIILLPSLMDAQVAKNLFNPKHLTGSMQVDKIPYGQIPPGGAVIFGAPKGSPFAEEAVRELEKDGVTCRVIPFNEESAQRKTFNVYLDLELVKLVDLWAYRSGTSRSKLIEQALDEFFPYPEGFSHSKPGCPHADLVAKRNGQRGVSDPVAILGDEYVPE